MLQPSFSRRLISATVSRRGPCITPITPDSSTLIDIALAAANGLVLKRGTYRPQPEPQGGYLRYRMTLPVTGQATAIQQFIKAALKAQRSLSLESVQFKRERGESSVVEAHIQWSLLTRLPSAAGGSGR